eukprot:jgi/Ulvmu1/11750/UM008_0164.1
MGKEAAQGRIRSGPSQVILCVLGAVCSLPSASAEAQQSAAPANDIDFTPQPGNVWSCTAQGCSSSPNIYTDQDIAAWELKDTDYAESCETFDYDYDTAFEDGFYAAACSWQTDCKNPDCEGKCIVNIYQDLNDQAAGSPGQLDHNQDTIVRDTKLAWGLTCPMIASTIYRYADQHSKGRPELDSLTQLPAPGMACPTDADIERVVTDINLTNKNFKSIGAPYNSNSDDMIWPFSYAAATEGNGEPFMGYIGTADALKKLVKERCTTAVVSDALMNLVVANGVWQYSFLLEDQGFSMSNLRGGTTGGDAMSEKSEPNAGLTLCRDNQALLENLLTFAVAKPNQADKVMAAVTDLPHGQCFGVRSASQLALDVPWISFGDERSCEEESAVSLRTIHEACAKLTTKERCVQARFEDDQKLTVSYMNAMDSEVSTAKFTDPCMVSFMNPWTGEVHDPQTTNEVARSDYEEQHQEMLDAYAYDTDADAGDDVDDEDYAEFEADYGEDTTEDVYYGDEDDVYDSYDDEISSEEDGRSEYEAGIGVADSEAIGTAASETRTSGAGGGARCGGGGCRGRGRCVCCAVVGAWGRSRVAACGGVR